VFVQPQKHVQFKEEDKSNKIKRIIGPNGEERII
jgi:hypothetical protein